MNLRLLLLVPPLLACAPARLAADGGTTTSQSSTDGSTSWTSEESESKSESEDSSDSTSTGLDFLPSFDLGGPEPCDSFAQDCPEGEKCVPYGSPGMGWDGHKCVPVLGDQQPGEPCHYDGTLESTDDCDATSFCWDVTVGGLGTCAPFCFGSADEPQCPDPIGCRNYECSISGDSSVYLCLLSCDPLAQDCGHESLACYWANSRFYCLGTTAEQPIGEPCSASTDCVAGSTCVPAEQLPSCAGEACCAPFCDSAAILDPCPELLPGAGCTPFEEAGADLPDCSVGWCLAPPP